MLLTLQTFIWLDYLLFSLVNLIVGDGKRKNHGCVTGNVSQIIKQKAFEALAKNKPSRFIAGIFGAFDPACSL